MNQKVKTELDEIVSTLAETGIVTKIILFGSYAIVRRWGLAGG
jgi:predicted nucleotidyltransferase